ncbi:MAG: hypothetical protein ACLFSB_15160, partial [Chitinispirillaceae bacterium]
LREANGWSWSGSRRAARGKRVVLVGLSQSCERQTGGPGRALAELREGNGWSLFARLKDARSLKDHPQVLSSLREYNQDYPEGLSSLREPNR